MPQTETASHDTWTGTAMKRSQVFQHTITAAEAVSQVERRADGLLLTMRTSVWGYDRPSEFADCETLRKRLGDGEPLYYRIRFYQPGVVRLELMDAGGLQVEQRGFFLTDLTPAAFRIAEDQFTVKATFGDYTFLVEKGTRGNGLFRFQVLSGDQACHFETENQEDGLILFNYPPGKMTDHATGRNWFRESIALRPEERIYGFGEKFHPLDKRNRDVRIWHTDAAGCLRDSSYKNIPFFLSSRRYGALFNSPRAMRFEVGSHDCSSIGVDVFADRLDYLIMPGAALQEVLKKYAALTGQPRVPPRWTFGLWMSKCTYYSEAEITAVVQKFAEYDLPLTTMHLDTGWFDENWFCDWRFNKERFPDPAAMVKRFRKDGLRISLWQLPYVNEGRAGRHLNPAYIEGREGGYFAADAQGHVYGSKNKPADVPAEGVIDFSNPQARRWYQDKIRRLLQIGISAIKTDFGENVPSMAHYRQIEGADMHNLYPKLYNEAVWDVIREGFEQEPITWARSATVGCQTMPVHWGGDPSALWPHLAGSLWGGLSFGLSGGLFWSCDVGGFGGSRQPDEELYIRWLQFGTFLSHMRVHGNMPREPWLFGATAVELFRKFVKLRYRLLPYLVSEAKYCGEHMRPMMCALPLAFEDDPVCWGIHDQYMFGRSLMIAPILTPGGRRQVYLPAGAWFDYWTKEKIAGGRYFTIQCPLERYPIWVRDGAIIPMIPACNRLPEGPFLQLVVEVYHHTAVPAPYAIADIKPFEIRYEDGRLNCSSSAPDLAPQLQVFK